MFAMSVGACGSDDDDGDGQGGSAGVAGSSGSGGSAGGTSALAAPVIGMVMPMAPAGLHVTWSNVQTDCDEVEGERKSPTAAYAPVFKVPGYVDNSHDGTATESVEYTYRLRCRKGTDYSPYSNEMSGTPQ
jgi:hypothetical protein